MIRKALVWYLCACVLVALAYYALPLLFAFAIVTGLLASI